MSSILSRIRSLTLLGHCVPFLWIKKIPVSQEVNVHVCFTVVERLKSASMADSLYYSHVGIMVTYCRAEASFLAQHMLIMDVMHGFRLTYLYVLPDQLPIRESEADAKTIHLLFCLQRREFSSWRIA